MVFARDLNDNLVSLIKKLDTVSQEKKINSFVVFLGDEEKLPDDLKSLAEKHQLKKTVLAVDNPAGPKGYNIAKDADVSVMLYNKRKVEVNQAFAKGELNSKAVGEIIDQISTITPK